MVRGGTDILAWRKISKQRKNWTSKNGGKHIDNLGR